MKIDMKLNDLFKLGFMPRWAIVFMDIFLSFASVVLSFLLRFNFQTEKISSALFISSISVTLPIYLICFFLFKSYKEIIRHTTFTGIFRQLKAVGAANILLIILNVVFKSENSVLVPKSVLFINFFISFFMLSANRVLIKEIFRIGSNHKKEPILIFGAGNMGMAAVKTIVQNEFIKWKIVGFVDDDRSKTGKFLLGIQIYHTTKLNKVLKNKSVNRILFAVNNISISRRNEVASFFVDNGIMVSTLPPLERWAHDPFKINDVKDIKIEDLLEREPIIIDNYKIGSILNNKCILITGAAGSIGSEIVRQVMKFKPSNLILCDAAETPLHTIDLELKENFKDVNYKTFVCNITDEERMEFIFNKVKPNIVFHAAAYKHVPLMEAHPREAVVNNVWGTKIIADLALKYDCERFVMISTDKAVNPTNVMGASKRIAEMYIQTLSQQQMDGSHLLSYKHYERKTKFITTRFGNVLGSNGSVIPRFKSQLEKGGPLTVTHPEITRFFMTISEACQLVLEAGAMGNGGEIFVFDMGQAIKISDLAKKMISLAGLKPGEDIKIEYTGLRPGEKLYEEVLADSELTLPTYHPKIKIAKARPTINNLEETVNYLMDAAKSESEFACVKAMKKIVTRFKSNNSVFEELDTEINAKSNIV
jgi:FlaA1/EpsC-like NDP-sugar epimerase